MTHFRTQLRTQAKAVLDTALAADNANVYINRVAVLDEDDLPAVVISTDFDRRELITVGSAYRAEVDMTLTVYVKAISGVDTALDALCAKIEAAFLADQTIDAVVALQSTSIEVNDADMITGQAEVTYLVTIPVVTGPEDVV